MTRNSLFVLYFLSVACSSEAPPAEDHAAGDDHSVFVELGQATAWGIETGMVSASDVTSRITVPGVLGLNENRTAHITSFVTGKVVGLSVDLGANVRQGQVLLTINSPEFADAQAEYLDANSRCNLARRDYERALELWETRSIEERDLLRHEAELGQCFTDLAASESSLHSYGVDHDWMDDLKRRSEDLSEGGGDPDLIADANLPIYSPIDGRVIFRDVVVGEHVDPTHTLFTVSRLGTLWALLDVYENDLSYVRSSSDVIVKSPLFPATDFPGRIVYISDVVDETLRTVQTRVEVTNTDGLLKPNMYIQGIVQNRDESAPVIAIPDEAIVMLHGEQTVFLLGPPEPGEDHLVFLVQHVETGELVGDLRVVTAGLEEGQTIVFEGAFTLKSEIDKSAGGHEGHVH
jgi:cobalt-zinc-cadmium efflux system membrane fusion protein